MEGVQWLKKHGFKIHGVVIDAIRGIAQALRPFPVQLCQFHQILTVHHYLTQDPELDASRKMLDLVNTITKMDKESFIGAFNEWYERNKEVINERIHDKRIKKETPSYMHPGLRSAYLSIRRNLPLLWTFYDYPSIGLPDTNNGLEGIFSDIKTKKLFKFMRTFFLQHLFGHFCPSHRLRSYGYAPSSNDKTGSKICYNKRSLTNLNSF